MLNNLHKRQWGDSLTTEMHKKLSAGTDMQVEVTPEYKRNLGLLGRFATNGGFLKLRNNIEANRYLWWQEKRIHKAIDEGNKVKAMRIWFEVLKRSKCYQVLVFHRTVKSWYWDWSIKKTEDTLLEFMQKIRQWDLKLVIRRFYIPKKNGKLRPIGAPNWESRMISKAFTDIVYALTEKDRLQNTTQHGYMKNRGVWSAILKAIKLFEEGNNCYEFDLKSFFNTVQPFIIIKRLAEIHKNLAYSIGTIIRRLYYEFEEIKPEAELIIRDESKLLIERRGVPQGLSLSPLLSTWALETYGTPEKLVMYADDGLFFYKGNNNKFYHWINRLGVAGIKIAQEKSSEVGRILNFCGYTLNIREQWIEDERGRISWNDKHLVDYLKGGKIWNSDKYRKEYKWNWNIHKESWITHLENKLTILQKIIIIYKGYMYNAPHKGQRCFIGRWGIYDIAHSSARCQNQLLGVMKYKWPLLSKVKPYEFFDTLILEDRAIGKRKPKKYVHNSDRTGSTVKYNEFMLYFNAKERKVSPHF